MRELRENGVEPVFVDVRQDGVDAAKLALMVSEFGDALINRRSTTWRNLSEVERQLPPLDLLARNPTLMKRPVIEHRGRKFLGWDDAVRDALIAH